MIFGSIARIFVFFLDLFMILGSPDSSKDLEIILLRQQIRILQRKMKTPPRISASEKMILAALTHKISRTSKDIREQLHQVMLIFKPDTVLAWHRGLVRCKWRFIQHGKPGRPKLSDELEVLIVEIAKDNSRWGYEKIQGELLKLGYQLSVSSVRNILKRHRVTPVSQRSTGSWRSLIKHYQDQILACDFFTVETIWLKTIYVLFFIELGTRQIRLAGCTSHPNQIWVSQQARQLAWELQDQDRTMLFLIHDHDAKFTSSFDGVFSSQGIKVMHTPYQSPKANAYAERWVRSAREECLDQLLVMNENHLHCVLKEYVKYYNCDRPHQGMHQHFPISGSIRHTKGLIRRRDILGGIIHDYYRQSNMPVSGCG